MDEMTGWVLGDDLTAYVRSRGGILTIGVFDTLIG